MSKSMANLFRTAPALTIMLHKPAGFVSTRKDPHARDTVFLNLIPQKYHRLFNIGRLDAQTEGLLLLTNDGELAQRFTHPRHKIDKICCDHLIAPGPGTLHRNYCAEFFSTASAPKLRKFTLSHPRVYSLCCDRE